MHTHTRPWIVRQRDGWSFHGIQNSAAIAQNPYFFNHSKTQNLVDLQIVFKTHRRVPHSLSYKTRWVCSHSTQWILQKSVSEDLFQSTAKEEFHILSEGQEKGQRVAAATFLKNFLKKQWTEEGGTMSAKERCNFRNQLVEVLLCIDGLVLKQLAEALHQVAINDFAKTMMWPELVPTLKAAIRNSDVMIDTKPSRFKTINVLLCLQQIIKPFRYSMDPMVALDPVPDQLELICKELLAPLHDVFHHLVQQVAGSKEKGFFQHDNILLIICKCFHHAMKVHMPPSLLTCLELWFQDIVVLLDMIGLKRSMDFPDSEPRLKLWKRCLQIYCNLATQHHKHVDKFLPPMSSAVLKIVGHMANVKELHPMQQCILSLSFDIVSIILETGPGWQLLAPHFSDLLEKAIFPTLIMREMDIVEWEEDGDEYLQKNLPTDVLQNEGSGGKEVLTPRRSALNLLGLIATAKGPPTAVAVKNVDPQQQKKEAKRKNKDDQETAGNILVMPFLSQFPLPPDGSPPTSELVINYYGVIMAYASIQQFFDSQEDEMVTVMLQTCVFPLYSMLSPNPYVLANANWLLGELATCLPEDLSDDVFNSLTKALLAPDASGISWQPVRASAAGALSLLLEEDYKPTKWLPLLQAAVAGACKPDKEACVSLHLLAAVAESGEEDVAPYVPAISAEIQRELSHRFPPHPQPWPQMVELGFAALASLAQTWDSAEPDEDEDDGKALLAWKAGSSTMASTFSRLLQQAWLTPPQEGTPKSHATPLSSCLSNASVLLATILRCTPDADVTVNMSVELLLLVWANLVANWTVWADEEDEFVFDAIQEAIALQGRHPMLHFTQVDAAVSPHSILDCLSIFATTAMDSTYPSACWRACRCSHALLHVSSMSFEGEEISKVLVPRFSKVATKRLQQLSSVVVPLAKPLILVISMCFIMLPDTVEKILSAGEDAGAVNDDSTSHGLLMLAEALAGLAGSKLEPGLSLESEMKLAAMGLRKVLDHMIQYDMLQGHQACKTAHHCLCSLLEVTINLKELLESSETNGSHPGSDSEDGDDKYNDNEEEDDSNEASESEDSDDESDEEFLEQYAKTAHELQKDVTEEAKNGQDEDGHEVELGVLALVDHEAQVLQHLKVHGKRLLSEQPLPKELIERFKDKFPESKRYFP